MVDVRQADVRYLTYVKKRWLELPRLNPQDSIISAEIQASWERCVAAGLTPQVATQRVQAMFERGGTESGREAAAAEGHHIFCLDMGGQNVTLSVLELQTDSCVNSSVAEERIGTNAMALACHLKRGVFVNGSEHYAEALHSHYTYAEPILDAYKRVRGICCIDSENSQIMGEQRSLVHILASIGSTIYRMALNNHARRRDIAMLLDRIPQGIVYIDRENVIRHFNRLAIKAFGLENTSEDSIIFARCVAMICNSLSDGRQSAMINYRNNKKGIYVNAVPLFEEKNEKLLVVTQREATRAHTPAQQAKWTFEDILTITPRMIQVKEKAARAAAYNVPIMLVGKSGSGKEMFAQSIHNASNRSHGPFVPLNLSAIAPHLVESTLFGYVRGAFTGASLEGKIGYFEAANGGTLFLDEIDSSPFDVQTKLLRAISSKSIRRVGGTEDIPVDVRLISAGRVDVLELTREHVFREDLYYRLSPVKIRIPDLAERRADIPVLTRSFLENEARALVTVCPEPTEDFMDRLCAYTWPGNVRELHNALCHALIFLEPGQPTLEADMLPDYLPRDVQRRLPQPEMDGIEKKSVLRLAGMVAVCESLKRCRGNVLETARRLGISNATVYNYIEEARRYGLTLEEAKP